MNLKIVTLILALAGFAQAHIELGIYKGVNAENQVCSFEVKEVTYRDNVRHPLHEKVRITVDGKDFELTHPPVLNIELGTVTAEQEVFTGTVGVARAAYGVQIVMGESDVSGHGPQQLYVLFNDYRDSTKNTKTVCSSLVHQP